MEQSMIGFASGLSKAGYKPVIHTIAPFLVLRALDQIKIDFVLSQINLAYLEEFIPRKTIKD